MAVEGARHLHLDPVGGIAGDMFVAAMLDAAPDLLPEARALAAGIGPGVALELSTTSDHGLSGRQLHLALPGKERGPRHYGDYLAVLRDTAPDAAVAGRACDILRRLGEAEARAHGVPLERVHFHEISDWDSIADILLAAWLLERLHIRTASTGAVPTGSGRVETEHGIMPVPTPATAHLLAGLRVHDDGVPGERVTPTGAAILAHLEPAAKLPEATLLQATGYGFGTRRYPQLANMLRVTLHQGSVSAGRDRIGVVTFQIDDQTAEDLAIGLDRLRARPDVVEVLQFPAFGKKGRMVARVEVLCDAAALESVAEACFLETATIGLRLRTEARRLLERDTGLTRLEGHDLRIKRVRRPDGTGSVKPESDDLAPVATHHARTRLRARVRLDEDPTEDPET